MQAMRADLDDEEALPLSRPSFLFCGTQIALFTLGLGFWLATDGDLLASSSAEVAWDAAMREPIDRTTPLATEGTEILMRRSACEGWCPEYEVRIRADGRVHFQGQYYVCAFGDHEATVDPYAIRHLVRGMKAAGFGRLSVRHSPLIDAPVTILALVEGDRVTSVTYQEQDDDALIEMGERVDQVADTYRWLPIRTEFYRYCLNEDGTFTTVTPTRDIPW